MVTIILFLLSVILAIPTFGLSFIAFVVLKLIYDRATAENIAKQVFLSSKNDGQTYELSRVNRAAIRRLFLKYGTDSKPYSITDIPGGECYMGAISFAGAGDLVALVNYTPDRIIIKAVNEPPITLDGLMDGSFVNDLVTAHSNSPVATGKAAFFRNWKNPFGQPEVEGAEGISNQRIDEIYAEAKAAFLSVAEEKGETLPESTINGLVRDLLEAEANGHYQGVLQQSLDSYQEYPINFLFWKGRTY